jgi:HEAT repeat protein
MTHDRTNDAPKSAVELMRELERDPEYRAKAQDREAQRVRNAENYHAAAQGLLDDLAAAGITVDTIADLRPRKRDYPRALPILLHWLSRVSDPAVREDIVRTLSVPYARSAALSLIQEFKRTTDPSIEGLRWAIANALAVVADDTVFGELEELVRDKRWGKAREMLALALGNIQNPRAIPLLLELLDDEETVGHAAMALGKLKALAARSRLEALTRHRKAWIRKEATKALAILDSTE